MRVALINPPWRFEGSIYFGCPEPHLPLELGYARALLQQRGHRAEIFDGHLFDLGERELAAEARKFRPDMIVVTTAPTYLFWRCPPPELAVPQQMFAALDAVAVDAIKVAVGPHGSASPETTLRKLGADVVVMGECEESVLRLAEGERDALPGICFRDGSKLRRNGGPQAARFTDQPALEWEAAWIRRHEHHHHCFAGRPHGAGAEVEASRGCPYHCSFCAKEHFRDSYRRRQLPALMEEIDRLAEQGAGYLYFVDEIFLPNRALLEALCERKLRFGVQTRLDLWKPEMIELLGRAGCISIEAGVESLNAAGRDWLNKDCRITTDALTERLTTARRNVPFVQANLIATPHDDREAIGAWRRQMERQGIWANDPVPLFPYPGSPDYRRLWGLPDEQAWERAHAYYLDTYADFSDIQDQRPLPLTALERPAVADGAR